MKNITFNYLKTVEGYFLGHFCKYFGRFYFNIWSHCKEVSKERSRKNERKRVESFVFDENVSIVIRSFVRLLHIHKVFTHIVYRVQKSQTQILYSSLSHLHALSTSLSITHPYAHTQSLSLSLSLSLSHTHRLFLSLSLRYSKRTISLYFTHKISITWTAERVSLREMEVCISPSGKLLCL